LYIQIDHIQDRACIYATLLILYIGINDLD